MFNSKHAPCALLQVQPPPAKLFVLVPTRCPDTHELWRARALNLQYLPLVLYDVAHQNKFTLCVCYHVCCHVFSVCPLLMRATHFVPTQVLTFVTGAQMLI